jgi:small subunit ribosomal protein S3
VGQKVHPFGFRLGVNEDWHAHWFSKKQYGKTLIDDLKLRRFLKKRLASSEVSKLVIDKAGDNAKVTIFSARPGVVIGKSGSGIAQLRQELQKEFGKNIEISVQEVRNADTDASLVAQSIAEQLVRRVSYKRAMKRAGFAAMKAGAKGIKICVSGRIGGAEIARTEWLRLGSVSLHTLREKIDYSLAEAKTTYGMIGVKVWISHGQY